jgi:hypothetical protein
MLSDGERDRVGFAPGRPVIRIRGGSTLPNFRGAPCVRRRHCPSGSAGLPAVLEVLGTDPYNEGSYSAAAWAYIRQAWTKSKAPSLSQCRRGRRGTHACCHRALASPHSVWWESEHESHPTAVDARNRPHQRDAVLCAVRVRLFAEFRVPVLRWSSVPSADVRLVGLWRSTKPHAEPHAIPA